MLKNTHLPILKILPILLLVALISSSSASAQSDTLKVMQYNLLNYGNYTSYCPQSVNNVSDKDVYIKTILSAYYPDILTVCEMGRNVSLPTEFLRNNLNVNGTNYWMTKGGSNTNNSFLTNCIFYNSTKLTLVAHKVAQTHTRDVDVYDFKFKNDDSGKIILTCVVAHLKAGSGSSNEGTRKIMAENIMKYLEKNYRERNVLIMGDFNLYRASEDAYKAFTNESYYPNSFFIDPLYPYGVGSWTSNYIFEEYHTQSTHKDDNGCHSSGGMDDRFDFILMSENIYGGRDHVRYINNSYFALGQDGRHFNKSINSPANYAVSQEVADALYNNSDHLPVIMELVVNYSDNDVNELIDNMLSFDIFPNPSYDKINIRFYQDNVGKSNILLFNTLGQTVYSDELFADNGMNEYVLPIENLPKGLYFLRITNVDGLTGTIKVIKE